MMTKNQINEREQLEMLTIDQLVPQDHLVRKPAGVPASKPSSAVLTPLFSLK